MADNYDRDPYAIMLSDVMSRIKRSRNRTYVFAVGTKILTCGPKSVRKIAKLEKTGKLIGVYTGPKAEREQVSADISMVIDEIPEPDEVV